MNSRVGSNHLYIRLCKRGLKEFLEWPDSRIEEWTRELVADQAALGWIDHDSEFANILGLLVPDCIRDVLDGKELVVFTSKLEKIVLGGTVPIPEVNAFDWDAAKVRLDRLLNEAGESLESLRRQYC